MSRTMTSAMVASFLFLVACGGGGSAQVELKTGGDATPPPSDTAATAAASDVGEAHLKGDHLEIDHQILFDTDSDHINEAQSQKVLGDLVALLKAHPELVHLRIEGHTDVRGSAEHNQDLSERRAKAVAQYLNSHGLPNVKIDSKGYGQSKPLCSEDSDTCHDKNRRVEFLVVKD
ncbi:OmpA family protein [Polyangium fumosum]|uniref:OmpA family protein n=1 Tax=Polyangium fumosum TaxID=889272 RepID=A0A4U1JB57_9BACT|nr:OmpA family protein [Polyangium fumosum]TKD06574.1 OmpA family protein [Polyangium fumosum]